MSLAERVLATVAGGCQKWGWTADRCWGDDEATQDGGCHVLVDASEPDGLCPKHRALIRGLSTPAPPSTATAPRPVGLVATFAAKWAGTAGLGR